MLPKAKAHAKAKAKDKDDDNDYDNKDPFDGAERPVFKTMQDMMKWHHRIPPDQLPTFLNKFRVVNFIGAEPKENAAEIVMECYHSIFDGPADCKSMRPCITKGETISIWEPGKETATSAITFLQRDNCVMVLFLATLVEYQGTGLATFLFSLMHQVIKWREGRDIVHAYLKANPEDNKTAYD